MTCSLPDRQTAASVNWRCSYKLMASLQETLHLVDSRGSGSAGSYKEGQRHRHGRESKGGLQF